MEGSARPWRWNGTGSTCHCRSGAGSEGIVRVNPPASAMLEVSGPECRYLQRPSWDGPACSHRPVVLGVCHMALTTGWSERLAPTPGLSATTRMPCSMSCSAGPMPDSRSRCGLPIAPADRITSPSARATSSTPRRR